MIRHICLVLILSMFSLSALGQFDESFEEMKLAKAQEFAEMQDYKEAIKHYKELRDRYPNKIEYDYQVALCHYRLRDYQQAVKTVHQLVEINPLEGKYYRLLGNAYDVMGEYEKGINILNTGLLNMPYNGELYLDLGIIEMLRGDHERALYNWERGIKAVPYYPDNYYWVAKTYADSDEKIWTIMYAEMFLNLERGTERFSEISKLLTDTYINLIREIPNTGPATNSSNLSTQERLSHAYDWMLKHLNEKGKITVDEVPDSILDIKSLPLQSEMITGVAGSGGPIVLNTSDVNIHLNRVRKNKFEEAYLYVLSILRDNGILNLNAVSFNQDGSFNKLQALHFVRANFIELWMQLFYQDIPVPLFAWQFEFYDKKMFEAYNYWLLSNGDPDYFIQWQTEHETEFRFFLETLIENPLKVDNDNYFVRMEYVK